MSSTQVHGRTAAITSGADTRLVALGTDEAERALGQVAGLLGLAFGLVAFAFDPLIFGAVGITLGLLGKHTGSAVGRLAVGVAMLATVLGPTFGPVVHAVILGP